MFFSLQALSTEETFKLNSLRFQHLMNTSDKFIIPTEKFEFTRSDEHGALKGVITSGVSKESAYYLIDVDDKRYSDTFIKLSNHLTNVQAFKQNVLDFSPSLDIESKFVVGKFDFNGYSYNGFMIAGKNKRNSHQYIYEFYFLIDGDLYSLTYFTTYGFDDIFTQ
ncbi:hypothetical protein [Neptunicella marina]|uniref:Uncharacterized protein n=1 Tax=Neptunicella marina TaxID=2125989 RepID=A0A8J6M2E7_9ALTE|nr:hypothetical protein [Neptunicella marina]MBC3766208.1 hypothetical protein [Neptunicella marina]